MVDVSARPPGNSLRTLGFRSEEPVDTCIAVAPVDEFVPRAPSIAKLGDSNQVRGGAAATFPFSSNAPPLFLAKSPETLSRISSSVASR
ncbi:hypothetical protein RHA1_ro11073 (plasmid) [Rhodococcus jostii RHA1]|uniref:Uncharacterized protein n=1 Tax=Rhodococcus jostii (strain RHA1) TaxID=101510 RepID=Q0RVG6_RHOJR|nr:hypothetical protein RHA1_ro11073 [Rhodococcus jostii RHA1]